VISILIFCVKIVKRGFLKNQFVLPALRCQMYFVDNREFFKKKRKIKDLFVRSGLFLGSMPTFWGLRL